MAAVQNEKLKINVGIIFGGRSVEHEVSIISAHQAMAALDHEKYHPVPIYISKEGEWYSGDALLDLDLFKDQNKLKQAAIPVQISTNYGQKRIFARKSGFLQKAFEQELDVVLPVVHGTSVEDGCLQGLLELAGIPYAGPAVLGSAVGMDKTMMKAVLAQAGLPIVRYKDYAAFEWHNDQEAIIQEIENTLGYPLVVKPANLGSSIGISKADSQAELLDAIELAFSFSARLIVEEAITPLREINCAVLGAPGDLITSACEEPAAAEELLTFADKYLGSAGDKTAAPAKGMSGAKRRIIEDDQPLIDKITALAAASFTALDCCGVCRVDFLINSDSGEIYVNEINTIPGSLSFYLFEPIGLQFSALIDRLLKLALARKRSQDKLTTVYESNILAQGGSKGKK